MEDIEVHVAATALQRAYRKYSMGMEQLEFARKNRLVISIQKVARGYIVRTSERYTLAQIYIKLPPFWREVMKIKPARIRREDRAKVQSYQIKELRESAQQMTSHILDDVVKDRTLAPKLPFVVPQPFDKQPYVSLSDGRRLNFANINSNILNDEYITATKDQTNFLVSADTMKYFAGRRAAQEMLKEREGDKPPKEPIHSFNLRYWPITQQPKKPDTSTTEHDPTLNSFDIICNKRTALSCEVCRTRLRIIQCNTCMKGFCFYCAFRTHTTHQKRAHNMSIMEPRIIQYKKVETSLVYHVEMAQSVQHDLGYLIKFMRSAAEVKRITREKQLLKEFELAEEQRRIAFLKASEEMKEFHAAATQINCLFRKNKAVSIVKHKKLQNQIEVAMLNEQRFHNALLVIQKTLRMCSVRMWIHSFGKDFNRELVRRSASVKLRKKRASNTYQSRSKPVLDSQSKRERVRMDNEKRTRQNRVNLMHSLEMLYGTVIQLLEANILAWHDKHTQLLPVMQAQLTLRDSLYELHKFESTENLKILLNCTNNERDRRELLVKCLHLKLEAAGTRLENTRNMVWWITQHLRMLYRKLSILKVRFQDTLQRIQWVSVEYAILQRMEFHMDKRITVLSTSIPEMLPVADWVKGYLSLVVKQCILLDCMQETMVKEEINRLQRDERIVIEFDSLIVELLNSLHADNQYTAEKVHLDVALKYEVYGSAKGIELNEQLIALKSKQKTLTTHTLDNLKTGLQEKYDLEDTNNLNDYGFPNDNPDLPIEQLHTISAVMIETFNNSAKHCKLYDFLSVYLVQPWLAEQSVEDVRLEEQIAQKELSVGTLREQLKNIRVVGKNNEIKKTQNEKRIKALGVELEGKYEGREGEGESEMKDRLELVANMQQEILALQTENTMITNSRADISAQEAPILFEIGNISNEIGKIQESLKTRADARAKQSKVFFELERTCAAELAALAENESIKCEYTMMEIERHISLCEQYSSSEEVIQGVITNTNIELHERVPINVPLQTLTHRVHQLNHQFRPRTCSTPVHAVRTTIQTRRSILGINQAYYESVKAMLDKEIADLSDFPNKLDYYINAVKVFDDYAVNNRRQRALQIEINLRKLRLEALRGLRLQTMMEAKQKQIEQDKLVATKKAEKAAAKKSVVKELAKNTKLAIRAAQDKIRDMRYQNDIEMDAEEQKMARNIREKSKEGVGSIPEAIKEICFTWGREKTDFFQQQNDHLKSKGLPFFVRMPRSIGNSVYIWTQSTKDSNFFITHFELAHPDPANELLYKEPQMRKKHFELIECAGTRMQIWVKRDRRREYGIKNISLSFTEEEETRLIVDKYSKIDISLAEFGLPDTFLWVEKVDKVKTVEVDNTNKLIAEIKKVKALLDSKPDDKNIQAVVERLGLKLEAAYAKEKEAEVTNPLQAATDLLALNEAELSQWMQVFRSIDKKKASRVTLMDVFEYFEETPTPVTREVFLGAESLDREGLMEFGDFVRACAIFCLFGKQEVIQFLYVFVDKDRVGYMTYEDFSQLLESLHPYEKLRARRVLKALNHPKDYHVDFKEFSSYCDRFPAAYSPIFNLQNSMRKKTMGIDWWFHKMQKYKEVRRKMGAEGGNIQQIVDTELQRFTDDAVREKRMAERDAKIKQETSEIKKVIMQARQFLDEFS